MIFKFKYLPPQFIDDPHRKYPTTSFFNELSISGGRCRGALCCYLSWMLSFNLLDYSASDWYWQEPEATKPLPLRPVAIEEEPAPAPVANIVPFTKRDVPIVAGPTGKVSQPPQKGEQLLLGRISIILYASKSWIKERNKCVLCL